jgi:polyhydroxybutyrate depolymerase
VAYLGAVIDDVAAHYTVDPKRFFVIGHSNGGFMAHRLACEIGGRSRRDQPRPAPPG